MNTIREKCSFCGAAITIQVDICIDHPPISRSTEHTALVNKFLRRYKSESADEVRRILEQVLYEMTTERLRERLTTNKWDEKRKWVRC